MSSGTGNAKDKAPHGSVERYVSITYFTAGACYRHAIATVRLTVACCELDCSNTIMYQIPLFNKKLSSLSQNGKGGIF